MGGGKPKDYNTPFQYDLKYRKWSLEKDVNSSENSHYLYFNYFYIFYYIFCILQVYCYN